MNYVEPVFSYVQELSNIGHTLVAAVTPSNITCLMALTLRL